LGNAQLKAIEIIVRRKVFTQTEEYKQMRSQAYQIAIDRFAENLPNRAACQLCSQFACFKTAHKREIKIERIDYELENWVSHEIL